MAGQPDSPQPEGNASSPVGAFTRRIELLLKIASIDPAFRSRLLHERAGAAETFGLTLTEVETSMLAAAPREQLEAIIAQTVMSKEQRLRFLPRALHSLMSMGAEHPFALFREFTRGINPDRPERRRDAPESPDDRSPPFA